MALRQLIIGKKIETLNAQLDAMRKLDPDFVTRKAALAKREADLTEAVKEVTADTAEEDRKAVESDADQLETDRAALQTEQAEHDKQKAGIEDQIRALQAELDELNARAATPPAETEPHIDQREDEQPMVNRTRFFGMTYQERDAFFARTEVKDFLQRFRDAGREKRAITGAGLTIPDNVLPLIRQNVENYSKLISRVNFKPIRGTARQTISGAIPEAVWTEMVGKINELSFTFSQVTVDGYKVAGFVQLPLSIIEDSDLDLMSELLNSIGQAIGIALDKAIVYGTGTKMPVGIVTRLAQTAEPEGYGSNARQWEDLHTKNILAVRGGASGAYTVLEGIELFKGIANAAKAAKGKYSHGSKVWLMNESTHLTLSIAAMSINAAGAIVSGVQNAMPVIGGDIIDLDFIPDGEIVMGYIDEYLLVERKSIQLASNEALGFTDDTMYFKGTARYDGLPVIAEGFVAMAINAGTPTTSMTFATDTANKTTSN